MRQNFKDVYSVLKEWRARNKVPGYTVFVTGKVIRLTKYSYANLMLISDSQGLNVRIVDGNMVTDVQIGDKVWVKGEANFSDVAGLYLKSEYIQTNRY